MNRNFAWPRARKNFAKLSCMYAGWKYLRANLRSAQTRVYASRATTLRWIIQEKNPTKKNVRAPGNRGTDENTNLCIAAAKKKKNSRLINSIKPSTRKSKKLEFSGRKFIVQFLRAAAACPPNGQVELLKTMVGAFVWPKDDGILSYEVFVKWLFWIRGSLDGSGVQVFCQGSRIFFSRSSPRTFEIRTLTFKSASPKTQTHKKRDPIVFTSESNCNCEWGLFVSWFSRQGTHFPQGTDICRPD